MRTHTPGPWRVSEENCGGGLNIVGPRDVRVGYTGEYRDAKGNVIIAGEAFANGHLMAAAPDLYDALKALLPVFAEPPGQLDYTSRADDAIQRATDALSRASGGADRG